MLDRLRAGEWLPRVQDHVQSMVQHCSDEECQRRGHLFPWTRRRRDGVRTDLGWYCSGECLERGLLRHIQELLSSRARPLIRNHRIPIGLVLLSHSIIDREQLATALQHQRSAGTGKLGEWLRQMGAVDEQQITKALSEQYCCPVLKSANRHSVAAGLIPFRLLETYRMLPVHYVESTRTMYLGFAGRVDQSALYAIEQMLDCRAEPCIISESRIDRDLERSQHGNLIEVVFDTRQIPSEMARITRSYVLQSQAEQIKLVAVGDYLWVRLVQSRQTMNLLFRTDCAARSYDSHSNASFG